MLRVEEAIMKGKKRIVDLDLKAYFDSVRHEVLLSKVALRVQDPDVLRLLKLILKSTGKQGVPQGGVISPVLSNLYLNEVDRMLEKAIERMALRGSREELCLRVESCWPRIGEHGSGSPVGLFKLRQGLQACSVVPFPINSRYSGNAILRSGRASILECGFQVGVPGILHNRDRVNTASKQTRDVGRAEPVKVVLTTAKLSLHPLYTI